MNIINRLNAADPGFRSALKKLLDWTSVADTGVQTTVDTVIQAIRERGDEALLEFTAKFDRLALPSAEALAFTEAEIDAAVARTPDNLLAALEAAAVRISAYAERQKMQSWSYTEADGTVLGQQITPLDRVGLYVPGGKAAYPSSVLMNAIPARVAGVRELVMVVPTPDGVANDTVLAAARVAGVDRIFRIGGAQAVAALAYGTATVPAVDKIVGPGNIYVAAAKRAVFGKVGIDMIAGPSEILIVSDGLTDPDWIAMDLFSQAEHDQQAQAILISPDAQFLDRVAESVTRLVESQPRADIIRTALADRGALIAVKNLDEAIALANEIAPEHLELSFAGAENRLSEIRHAGAIFVGKYTAEALGDYCAGPNHVLPTSGTARFSSPLGVYDFQKRSSIIQCSAAGSVALGELAVVLAESEGLYAHAQSARYRVEGNR
ncbi:histidinol dehydrogenase [Halothiobacillus diazotrophicus]|uniref:Histidinol dehydrogenase n=1 Tax=Halothiobacillus diazotrophicus TaxID=1860122 RepID=A0A191ZE71_9GAMM|nr:histidinol dehydrogenase [Halothiobacillus diazotrophicus]ANJ66171.1 histidinol dehydrogenase [Halothiobacillus diazotrophicus]